MEKINSLILKTIARQFDSTQLDTSSQTLMPISIKYDFKPKSYHCKKHRTYQENECIAKQCANAICNRFINEITSIHRDRNPLWVNTNPCKWVTDPWEVAKCFMSTGGYKDTHNAKEVDCSGLLSMMINLIARSYEISDFNRVSQLTNIDRQCISKYMKIIKWYLGQCAYKYCVPLLDAQVLKSWHQ